MLSKVNTEVTEFLAFASRGCHNRFFGGDRLKNVLVVILSVIFYSSIGFSQGWIAHSPTGKVDLVAVYFTSASRGFVAGDEGYLASTGDGGKTWTKYFLNTNQNINEIYFRNEDNGYLVAGRLLFITQDGGRTWQETRIYKTTDFKNGAPELISIRFSDKKRGLAIGSIVNKNDEIIDSLVMKTDDGGSTWTRVIIPSKAELFHLDFNGNSHGWIVGDKGLILTTDDGGANWRVQRSGVSRALFSVDFRDDNDGFAVGGGGTIIRTEDGGRTWEKVSTNFTDTFKRVNFADDKNGWIVGHKGTILRTQDKGRTWVRQESNIKADLYGLFMQKKYGWAVGAAGSTVEFQK